MIQGEGVDALEDVAVMEEDTGVTEMAKRPASRATADGRVLLGTAQVKRVQKVLFGGHMTVLNTNSL